MTVESISMKYEMSVKNKLYRQEIFIDELYLCRGEGYGYGV